VKDEYNPPPASTYVGDIWLNKGERALLKHLSKIKRKKCGINKTWPPTYAHIAKKDAKDFLKKKGYDYSPIFNLATKCLITGFDGDYIAIVKRGLNWLEVYKERKTGELFNRFLAVTAIIISVIALLR